MTTDPWQDHADALATHRDVHVWLPQPSPALWDALDGLDGPVPRVQDHSAELVGHPLDQHPEDRVVVDHHYELRNNSITSPGIPIVRYPALVFGVSS